ncbi:MAG: O-antigen ligase family protein [Clostridia bacterium]|nr:O-antigen ligase family protein [Clostridia bacterium]
MRKWVNTAIVGMFWLLSLVKATGFDDAHRITDRARIVLLLITAAVIVLESKANHGVTVKKNDCFLFGGMALVFLASSFLNGKGAQPLEYLYAFLVVFLISRLRLDESDFERIGFCFGLAGFAVLYIYKQTTLLDGWNENSIAMIGLFSYLVFLIPLFRVREKKTKALIAFTAIAFSYFINYTGSRSCIVFLAIALLFAIGLLDRKILYRGSGFIYIILLAPLFVAVFFVLIPSADVFRKLDMWSIVRSGKTFLNGRNILWQYGFRIFFKDPWLGCGNLMRANWHNSAVCVLTAYGALGYYFWIQSFHTLLGKARPFWDDYLIQGCICGFMVIYLQQSVELGLVSTAPDLIPYIILGMMFGRINYIRSTRSYSNDVVCLIKE